MRIELPILDRAAQGCADHVGGVDAAVDQGFLLPFQRVHPDIDFACCREAFGLKALICGRCRDLRPTFDACLLCQKGWCAVLRTLSSFRRLRFRARRLESYDLSLIHI